MNRLQVIFSCIALAATFLTSCADNDDGISGTGFNIVGTAEKGPFVKDSDVVFNHLTSSGKLTSKTVTTTTIDNLGNFNITTKSEGPVLISINGEHFNEITGEVSENEILLNAIYNISSSQTQTASVNVLTHVISQRVLKLMANEIPIDTAIRQSQQEFSLAMEEVLVENDLPDFTRLSVYDINKDFTSGNAYLLAFSSITNQYAENKSDQDNSFVEDELLLLLNSLADDLADDGNIVNETLLKDLNVAKSRLIPNEIENNLRDYSFEVTGEELDVPTIAALIVITTLILNKSVGE